MLVDRVEYRDAPPSQKLIVSEVPVQVEKVVFRDVPVEVDRERVVVKEVPKIIEKEVYRELPPAKRVHVDALPHNRVPFVLVHPSQAEVAEAARARTPAAASPAPTGLRFSPSRFVGTIRAPAEPAPGASPRPTRARPAPALRPGGACSQPVSRGRASRGRPEGPQRVRRLVDRVSRARFAVGRAGRARAASQPLACRRAAPASPRSGGGHARRRPAAPRCRRPWTRRRCTSARCEQASCGPPQALSGGPGARQNRPAKLYLSDNIVQLLRGRDRLVSIGHISAQKLRHVSFSSLVTQ